MLAHWTDRILSQPGRRWRNEEAMGRYGIRNLMRVAKTYNQWRYADRSRRHQQAYETDLNALLEEHGGPGPFHPAS
jgi:hypothetical protein